MLKQSLIIITIIVLNMSLFGQSSENKEKWANITASIREYNNNYNTEQKESLLKTVASAKLEIKEFHELTNEFTNLKKRDLYNTLNLQRSSFITYNSKILDYLSGLVKLAPLIDSLGNIITNTNNVIQTANSDFDVVLFFIYYDSKNNPTIEKYLNDHSKIQYEGRISIAIAFTEKAAWKDENNLADIDFNLLENRTKILKINEFSYHIYNLGELCPDTCPALVPY
ncbi:MAG: hypothetical protein KBF59_05530 [Ignavibacterium sp.]|nr:hypothetical protein [Ignavibacterium sp.]